MSPGDTSECAEPLFTFRDPAGQLKLTRAHALRRIHPGAVEETLAFLNSPLRAALERSGDLIPSEIVQSGIVESGPALAELPGELWLQHPRIDPISYPWEWTTAQWRSAADLTLRIASQAIDAGWMLKDATPLNILFAGARPVLVDVLSLERRDPNSATWLAYGQFVRTFLLPLVAEKLLNWPLLTTLFFRDGYEPRNLYEALPRLQRLRPGLLDVVTLATLLAVCRPRLTPSSPHTFCTSASPAWASRFATQRDRRPAANGAAINNPPATTRPPIQKPSSSL